MNIIKFSENHDSAFGLTCRDGWSDITLLYGFYKEYKILKWNAPDLTSSTYNNIKLAAVYDITLYSLTS